MDFLHLVQNFQVTLDKNFIKSKPLIAVTTLYGFANSGTLLPRLNEKGFCLSINAMESSFSILHAFSKVLSVINLKNVLRE